jgi:type I restriction enzyme S subunit
MSVALNISGSDLQPGVFWLGKLPSDWRVKRLKFSVRLVSAKAAYGESDLPYTGLEHIEPWTGRYLADEEASPDGVVSHFEPGDVLFGKLRPYLAKVHLAQHRGVCSTEALVLRAAEELLPEYLRYFLVAPVTIEHINSSTYGSKMPRASWDFIGDQIQPLPPLDQQQKIAAFLNRKTAEIDTLIAKKRRLLDRLAEKRTALITRAVTKGLNPDAPMKDSGIEWLGEIPAHWELWKVTHHFQTIGSGATPPSSDSVYYDGHINWVTTSELRESEISSTKTKITEKALNDISSLRVFREGSVVIAMYGATIGRLGWLGSPSTVNQACCVFSGSKIMKQRYLYYWLFAARNILISFSYGGGQPNLSQEYLRSLRTTLPPLSEQEEIIQYVDKNLGYIDVVETKVNGAIARLEEYRSALITNAVTGQIKVA